MGPKAERKRCACLVDLNRRIFFSGTVNLMTIVELYLLNPMGKWGAGPDLREETSPERSEMGVQWGKLIKQKF